MDARHMMKRAAGWLLARRRSTLWALGAAIALLMSGAAVYLAWRGFRLLTSGSVVASDTGAGIQALAAAVNLMATLCLVGVTTAYAFIAYKHLRLSGPDVSMDWHLAWVDLAQRSVAFKAPIASLRDGSIAEGHNAWFIAVELVNSGNQAVSIDQALLDVDGSFTLRYVGSQLSQDCPLTLGSHSSEALYFDQFDVQEFLAKCEYLKTKGPHEIQVHVHLGSGSSLSTSKVPLESFLVY